MKKTLLILLFCISSIAFSQNYQGYVPFPKADAYWFETYNTSNYCINYEHRFKGDTVINGLLYHEIETTEIDQTTLSGCGPPWNAQISKYTFGYIRNDSANKKVWLRLPGSSQDTLFYDFDLSVGDTIGDTTGSATGNGRGNIFYMSPKYSYVVVDSIDTVYLGGRYRRKIYFSSRCSPNLDYFIEGIGAGTGFAIHLESYCPQVSIYSQLWCMGDSMGGVYPDTSACRLITNISEKDQQLENIQLYPNPTLGLINLAFEKPLQSIEVYNLQGQKVQEINPKEKRWELPEQTGLYLIRIQDEEGNVYTEKIVRD